MVSVLDVIIFNLFSWISLWGLYKKKIRFLRKVYFSNQIKQNLFDECFSDPRFHGQKLCDLLLRTVTNTTAERTCFTCSTRTVLAPPHTPSPSLRLSRGPWCRPLTTLTAQCPLYRLTHPLSLLSRWLTEPRPLLYTQ